MCFSAEASFTAAVLLATIGSATLKTSTFKSEFFIAAIPLLFAIQQLSEGILWLSLEKNVFPDHLSKIAQHFFLTFAFLIWPVWIPLSLSLAEKVSWRRNIIYVTLFAGITLSFLNLTSALGQEISVRIVNHSIQYMGQAPNQTILYPMIVLIPCFVSSLRHMPILGVFIVFTYAFAYYFYSTTFVSVWCFFAAIASLSVYKILKDNRGYFEKKSQLI